MQNRQIQSFMKGRGWKLEEKYSDRKNDKDEDAGFQKLREDGMSRKFDMVVVGSIFRCGRSVSFAEDLLLKTFYPAGIHFAVAEDGFCSLEHSAEEVKSYLRDKRLEAGVSILRHTEREKERQGLFDVHDEKYGYRLKDDFTGFEIDEEVAPIIREVFQLLADNMTMKAVADLMNERGIESPAVHQERVGKKNFHANGNKWVLGSVQRIMQNTSYIGYWDKMVGGSIKTVEMPQIVDKELFDLAAKNVSKRGRHGPMKARSDNAFVKQIFDKGTGDVLVCRRYDDNGIYQKFHRSWSMTSEGICYEKVMQAAVQVLATEREQVRRICSILQSDEAYREKDRRISVEAMKAKQLFRELEQGERKRLLIYQEFRNGIIGKSEMENLIQQQEERLSKLDAQFNITMQEVETINAAFSMKNPWIVHYRNIEIPDRLTKKEVRKWIDRVVVEDLCSIEIELLYTEWKSYFPTDWLGRGYEDGEKKQA